MLKAILKPFFTSAPSGVTTRYLTVIVTTVVTVLGLLGWLDPAQVEALKNAVPELLTYVTGLIALLVPLYAVLTKSSSDKAAEAAKQIDAKLPPAAPVEIKTPAGTPNIFVPADKSGR